MHTELSGISLTKYLRCNFFLVFQIFELSLAIRPFMRGSMGIGQTELWALVYFQGQKSHPPRLLLSLAVSGWVINVPWNSLGVFKYSHFCFILPRKGRKWEVEFGEGRGVFVVQLSLFVRKLGGELVLSTWVKECCGYEARPA